MPRRRDLPIARAPSWALPELHESQQLVTSIRRGVPMSTRSCRTQPWLVLMLVCSFAVGGLLSGVLPASAAPSGVNGCIQDVWAAHGNSQNLTCTSGDVRISEVTNITVTSGGSGSCTSTTGNCTCNGVPNPPTNCATNPNQAGCFTFTADFSVLLNAQTRYDIGLYIATDGDPNGNGALTGTCFDSIVTST